MTWTLIEKPVTTRVTRKLAKEFAEMGAAPHDRPLSERRLQVYQRLLREGQFRPVTWAKALCTETGDIFRVNGKHTSVMLSGLEELPEFFVTVESYRCDTLEDVAKLYATFDSGLQSRTARDIYLSFAATVPELKVLPASNIILAVTGMSLHLGSTYVSETASAPRGQPADRAELLLDYPEFVLWLHGIMSAGEEGQQERSDNGRRQAKHLRRQPVAAAMFGSWQKARGPATEFWAAVRDETGEKPTLPDRKLARYLMTVGVDLGSGSSRVRPVKPREMYVKCLHAWNAWRRQETTNLNYYADKDIPAIK